MANKFIGDVDTVESITDEDSLFVNAADKLRKIKKNKVKLDYVNNINNKPRVNGVELSGDKSLDSLGIGSKTALDELSDKLNTCAPAIICEAQGKTIMVEDSSENYFNGLNIYGKTEQVQTKGYQLFDASKLPTKSQGGATVTNNGDGSFTISGSGNLTEDVNIQHTYSHGEALKMFKHGNLTLKTEEITNPYVVINIRNNNGQIMSLTNSNANLVTKDISTIFEDETSFIRIQLYASKNTPIIPGTIKPMLYQDGDGTWEPFSGGKPSPSPEYPQEIESVGGDGYIEINTHGSNLIGVDGNFKIANATLIDKDEYALKSNIVNDYYSNITISDKRLLKLVSDNMGKRINFKLELLSGTNEALGIVIYGDRKNGAKYQEIAGYLKASALIANDFINIKQIEFRWNRKSQIFTDKESVYTNLQCWIGEDEPDFQHYKESTASIQLDSPLYEGDYIYLENGELWEYRENARVVFDGSEDEVFNK